MALEMTTTRSAHIREQLGYPVIDADGHSVEYLPVLLEYLRDIAGSKAVEMFQRLPAWYRKSDEERRRLRIVRPPWWALPTRNTLDHVTSVLPKLLEERLGEMGLDFTVLYPSLGLTAPQLPDPELRQAVCRAVNTYQAELFRPHSARMTPAAAIPMHTPVEAIEELEYAVSVLGMKATMMAAHVLRPLPGLEGVSPHASFVDVLALDSAYDYDPVWQKCIDLKVVPAFHSFSMGWGSRVSISNYMYNHIGHFATSSEALCKALFFGGVTRRFPSATFMFLEAGVGWAVNLFADIIGHWEKRNGAAIQNYNPDNLDRALVAQLFNEYAGPLLAPRAGQVDAIYSLLGPGLQDPQRLDDFAAAGIEQPEDIVERFVPRFFFGCEADDPINSWAFATHVNPFSARLNAVFSSDIGHWDVPDMRKVLEEAYELVEHGAISPEDFRKFVFENPARLFTSMNPNFFNGTAVEGAVTSLKKSQDGNFGS